VDNIVDIKHSSTSLIQAMDHVAACPPDFALLAGNNASVFATLLYGAKGAIAATADIVPRLVVGTYDAVQAGCIDKPWVFQHKPSTFRKAFDLGTFPNMFKAAVGVIGLHGDLTRNPVAGMPERD
jgi:4-hydroxy-tetrahydrodipicolinate synthase